MPAGLQACLDYFFSKLQNNKTLSAAQPAIAPEEILASTTSRACTREREATKLGRRALRSNSVLDCAERSEAEKAEAG